MQYARARARVCVCVCARARENRELLTFQLTTKLLCDADVDGVVQLSPAQRRRTRVVGSESASECCTINKSICSRQNDTDTSPKPATAASATLSRLTVRHSQLLADHSTPSGVA
jgi:hypothetical protein